ncbi:tetratricopeptide repeat protein [Patescibacteria group bacterium]
MKKLKSIFLLLIVLTFIGVYFLFQSKNDKSEVKSIYKETLSQEALEIRNQAEEILLESRSGNMFYLPKIKEAEEEFKRVLAFGEDSDTYANLGIIYGIYGEFEHSEEYFIKALDLNPKNTFALNNLAKAYYDQKKLDLAKETWEKSLKVDINQSEVKNQLNKF